MNRYGSIATLFLAAAAASNAAQAQWAFEAQAGLRQDSNLDNARGDDIVADHALTAAGSAAQTTFFDSGDSLSWGGRAATESYARFSGLNNLTLGGFAAFRHKLGLGAYAPWLRAAWSLSRLSYANNVRDGWLHQADFGAGKRLDARWNLSANYRVEWRMARTQAQAEPGVSGDAFSGHAQTLLLGAEYAVSREMLLSAGGFARRGDVVSVGSDDDRVLAASKAAANDGVFGANRYAYRLPGTSGGMEFRLALALGPRSRLDFGMQRQVTHAAGGNNYAKSVESLTWVGSF